MFNRDLIKNLIPTDLKTKNENGNLKIYLKNNQFRYFNNFTNDSLMLDVIMKLVNDDNNDVGGAVAQLKKDKIKKIKEINPIPKISHSVFQIKDIGKEILNEIVVKYPFIFQNDVINDNKLTEILHQMIRDRKLTINNLEYESLIRYLRDNFSLFLKNHVIQKNSLFAFLSNSKLMNDVYEYYNIFQKMNQGLNYDQKIAITKLMSCKWKGIRSLSFYDKKIEYKPFESINPLFVILALIKIPGLEDLIIHQDYFTLIKELQKDRINKDNFTLLTLRTSDISILPTIDKIYTNNIKNEDLRISITFLLREMYFSVRSGKFNNPLSQDLEQILKKIKMPSAKTEEENLIQSILATFSFKPTLVTTHRQHMMSSGSIFTNFPNIIPSSVYTIEYPINDKRFNSDNPGILRSKNFKFVGYDSVNKKLIFLSDIFEDVENNTCRTTDDIFNNVLKMSYNRIEVDPNPSLLGNNDFSAIYSNITPVKILSTNGLFIISIPREEQKINSCYNTTILFSRQINPTINLKKIDIEKSIEINKITYEATGALCYYILDCDNLTFPYLVDSVYKIGTYALIKSENNKWIKYNPNRIKFGDIIDEEKNRLLKNEYESLPENRRPQSFEEFLETPIAKESIREYMNDKMCLRDMEIDEDDAFYEMSKFGTLIFYTEDYNMYKERLSSYSRL